MRTTCRSVSRARACQTAPITGRDASGVWAGEDPRQGEPRQQHEERGHEHPGKRPGDQACGGHGLLTGDADGKHEDDGDQPRAHGKLDHPHFGGAHQGETYRQEGAAAGQPQR